MAGPSTRRTFLYGTTTLVAGLGLAGFDAGEAQELTPTPACDNDGAPTLRQTEGPFFKPRSPERSDLTEPGLRGQPLELTGFVLTRGCRPVARALLDIWQADAEGQYDNNGARLRGHQFTDADGRYRLRTIVPASYPGRTRHIHVKVQPPNGRVLTTQLYFPGEAHNRTDRLFRRELVVRTAKDRGDISGRFDFVLDMR
jgi:protocatechuate 3,4-dioxygenase beta subunit